MMLDFPGPKTWAPFGDPSAADTQRSSEAFQSQDLDTAQWGCQKLLLLSETNAGIAHSPALWVRPRLM